ncbi:hypothetical protein I7I50_05540 [Histoplasma capsulatum G186AR]|uniref:Uncharacterized protein n=1 Tax=Ajellomyces capsulatus TaxID=5037 RepID=A0A8H7Z6X2_AJECA|nr:hypothetical protein I7I52_03801 [Histoplasma capsulatum]QSS76174.1 hypothetical protein I7I50_05540 [Histoplasma capsulatum G186AR]
MAHLVNLTGLMRCPSREPFNLTAHPQPTKWPTAYRRNRVSPRRWNGGTAEGSRPPPTNISQDELLTG